VADFQHGPCYQTNHAYTHLTRYNRNITRFATWNQVLFGWPYCLPGHAVYGGFLRAQSPGFKQGFLGLFDMDVYVKAVLSSFGSKNLPVPLAYLTKPRYDYGNSR
jgi:hypothetical protein